MPTIWVLVANRSRARILSQRLPGEPLQEVTSLKHPDGSLKQQDVETDRQGRFGERGNMRQAGDPETDFKHETAERFAGEIADLLDKARQRNQFGELVMIAAPLFLGVLRKKLPAPLGQMVTLEIDKDYTHLKPGELAKHLPATSP